MNGRPRAQRVLITGASSGIGAALAIEYASRGARIAITGRRADRLADVAAQARARGAAELLVLQGSVVSDDDVRRHAAELLARFGGIDLAILNAGVATGRDDDAFVVDDYARTLETNVLGTCRWIAALLPAMREARAGVLAGVSSPAAWAGFPGMGAYAASTAALSSLLQTLRIELRGSGVRVVTIEPGFVTSEITARNDPRDMPCLLPAASAARRIARALDSGSPVIRFPRRTLWPLRLLTLLPRAVFEGLASRLLRRRNANTPED